MLLITDSTDAREQREREAEQEAAAVAERRRHDAECVDGWRGEDAVGRPIPCTRCRPHLDTEPACRTCGLSHTVCRGQREARRGPCCDSCDHTRPGGLA